MNIIEKKNENKDVHNLNIEDLVSYINEPKFKTNNKKRQKEKRNPKKATKNSKK